MAARRLLIIMVVLLTISTLAAALVPPPEERGSSSTTSTATTTTAGEDPSGGELVRAEVTVQGEGARARNIQLHTGDQLALTVPSHTAGDVTIPDFGLIDFSEPGAPARFNILVEEEGRFPVRFGGKTIATIIATDRKSSGKA